MLQHELNSSKAVSYARWSSGRQSKGNSLQRQTELATAYCLKTGMELDTSIVDDGISAFAGSNLKAGLGRFLDGIHSGDIPADRVLLIENLDRFSRLNPMDVLPIFMDVLSAGLTIVTLQDEMVHTGDKLRDNPMLLIPSLVAMQLAHDESRKKSDRLKASWRGRVQRIASGERLAISKVPFWIDRETQQFNDRADDARLIFTLAGEGNGASAITRTLNARGIPSPNGGTWGKSVVQYALASKEAYGTLVLKGRERPGYYPAIISETRWLALRNRAAKQRNNPQAATDANLFPRLLVCGCCGWPMGVTSASAKGVTYKYAVCSGRSAKRTDCTAPNWPYNDFETLFVSRFGLLLSAPISSEGSEEPTAVETLDIRLEALEMQRKAAIERSQKAQAVGAAQTAEDLFDQAMSLEREARELTAERSRLLVDHLERDTAGDIIADLDADEEAIRHLWKHDRPALRNLIANVVTKIEMGRYDRGDISLAEVFFRRGGRNTLGLEPTGGAGKP